MNVSDVRLCRTTDVLNVSVVLLKFRQKLKWSLFVAPSSTTSCGFTLSRLKFQTSSQTRRSTAGCSVPDSSGTDGCSRDVTRFVEMLIRRAAFHSLGINICRHQLNCHLNSTQDGRVTCDGADEAEEPVTLSWRWRGRRRRGVMEGGGVRGYCRLQLVPADRPNEPAVWPLRSHRR